MLSVDPAHAPKFIWKPGDLRPAKAGKSFNLTIDLAEIGIKYDDSEPRDDHGRWTTGGGSDAAASDLTAQHALLYGDHAGTPADPVPCGADIERAAKIIAEGGNVTLNQPEEIATLLDKMQEIANEAKAAGKDAPTFDLCDVSVPGTNLFCQDHVVDDQGNPLDRVQMPQLATTDPVPGSLADQQPRNEFGEVDLSQQFAEFLSQTGRPPVEETVDAATLRASQDQLNGVKVAGIMDAIENGTYDTSTGRIWITSDNYVIDGHHRWAASVAEEYKTGESVQIPVRRIDMDIGTALTTANYWTEENGIQGRSLTAKRMLQLAIDLATLGIRMPKFDENQPRDDNGRWTSGGDGSSSTPSSDYRATWKPSMTPEQGHAWAEAAGTKWPGTVVHVTNAPAVRGIIGTGFHTESITTLHEAGAFFATDPATAEFYEYKGDDVVSAVVVAQNPLTVDLVPTIEKANSDGGWLSSFAASPEFRSEALAAAGIPDSSARAETAKDPVATTAAIKAQGYDSVIIHGLPSPDSMIGDNEAAVGGDQIVVFDKEQAVAIGTEPYDRNYSGEPNADGSATGIEDAVQRAFAKDFDESLHPRDDHGRFATVENGGGSAAPVALREITASATDEGEKGNLALGKVFTDAGSDDVRNYDNAPDSPAIEAKIANTQEIGAALAEKALTDPELASQLQDAAAKIIASEQAQDLSAFKVEDGKLVGEGSDYELNHLHLEAGMTVEQAGGAQVAALMQDSWMNSASDSNPGSWGMQLAAADLVGMDTSAAKQAIDERGLVYPNVPGALGVSLDEVMTNSARAQAIADSPAVKAYVSEVYDRTQSYLADHGVTGNITLFRGADMPGSFLEDGEKGTITMNPLSSFSTEGDTAAGFGYTVFQSTIPVERIFSMAMTGPACLRETEAIVLAGPGVGVEAVNPYGSS